MIIKNIHEGIDIILNELRKRYGAICFFDLINLSLVIKEMPLKNKFSLIFSEEKDIYELKETIIGPKSFRVNMIYDTNEILEEELYKLVNSIENWIKKENRKNANN